MTKNVNINIVTRAKKVYMELYIQATVMMMIIIICLVLVDYCCINIVSLFCQEMSYLTARQWTLSSRTGYYYLIHFESARLMEQRSLVMQSYQYLYNHNFRLMMIMKTLTMITDLLCQKEYMECQRVDRTVVVTQLTKMGRAIGSPVRDTCSKRHETSMP